MNGRMPATKWGCGVGLEFDKATHTYQFDGVVLPSVTQVLKAAGMLPDLSFVSDFYLNRGTQVHAATVLVDADDLEMDDLDGRICGYVEAWQHFRDDAGTMLEILETEVPAFDPCYRYAGTRDRVIRWKGKYGVLDLKTGTKAAWHPLQLAGYCGLGDMASHTGGLHRQGDRKRLGVYLANDGSYKLESYTDGNDWGTFTAAASLWHWREREGLHR